MAGADTFGQLLGRLGHQNLGNDGSHIDAYSCYGLPQVGQYQAHLWTNKQDSNSLFDQYGFINLPFGSGFFCVTSDILVDWNNPRVIIHDCGGQSDQHNQNSHHDTHTVNPTAAQITQISPFRRRAFVAFPATLFSPLHPLPDCSYKFK